LTFRQSGVSSITRAFFSELLEDPASDIRQGALANDARALATDPADIGDAVFPQLFLMYVRRAAAWSSLSRQSNAGIAGAVGLADVDTARDPCRTTRRSVVGSSDCTNALPDKRGKRLTSPLPESL
jgi:hypothetical protein